MSRCAGYKTGATMEMVRPVQHSNNTLLISNTSGYWSSGTRLGDSAQIEGQGVASSEYMPEYMVRLIHPSSVHLFPSL